AAQMGTFNHDACGGEPASTELWRCPARAERTTGSIPESLLPSDRHQADRAKAAHQKEIRHDRGRFGLRRSGNRRTRWRKEGRRDRRARRRWWRLRVRPQEPKEACNSQIAHARAKERPSPPDWACCPGPQNIILAAN